MKMNQKKDKLSVGKQDTAGRLNRGIFERNTITDISGSVRYPDFSQALIYCFGVGSNCTCDTA